MRELSLFSGAGGGLLGTKLLGWEHLGYVEFNEYCQKVIRQRIEDGILDRAPIFSDIRAFIDQGYADSYQGMVDVVTAGFPCQPFSVAVKQAGEDDPRNMWPQTIDVIRRVRPRFAFLENVPGLLNHSYARRIFGDLAESGYDVRWRVLSAAEVGAPHKRDRLWIVADSIGTAGGGRGFSGDADGQGWRDPEAGAARLQPENGATYANNTESGGEAVADTTSGIKPVGIDRGRTEGGEAIAPKRSEQPIGRSCQPDNVPNSDSQRHGRREQQPKSEQKTRHISGVAPKRWWDSEPDVGRVANGVASRVDRLKSLGNGQVPQVVAAAWEMLN